jgi:hypothetical protein
MSYLTASEARAMAHEQWFDHDELESILECISNRAKGGVFNYFLPDLNTMMIAKLLSLGYEVGRVTEGRNHHYEISWKLKEGGVDEWWPYQQPTPTNKA